MKSHGLWKSLDSLTWSLCNCDFWLKHILIQYINVLMSGSFITIACSVTRFHYHDKSKSFSRFSWQGLHYPWAFHAQMPHQIVSVPRGTYMLLISSRCSAMTQKVIKGTCPGIVMWPLHLCCRIPSSSGGCFLIELTVGEVFVVTAKLQQRLRMWGVLVVCKASLSFGEPHDQKAFFSYNLLILSRTSSF